MYFVNKYQNTINMECGGLISTWYDTQGIMGVTCIGIRASFRQNFYFLTVIILIIFRLQGIDRDTQTEPKQLPQPVQELPLQTRISFGRFPFQAQPCRF